MAMALLASKVPSFIDREERRMPFETDEKIIKAAELIANATGAGETGSAEKLMADARAFATLNKPVQAEKALRKALKKKPNDWRIEYELGLHLLYGVSGREAESIPYLESVVGRPDAPTVAWKNLGFACLWDANQLKRSAEATSQYLKLYPNDKEAQLWLTAAHARMLSPEKEEERKTFLEEFGKLVQGSPEIAERVRDEAEDGDNDDFKSWRELPEFQNLVRQ
jgi:tetratricopeptide (TPR) repeat protein